MIQSASVLNLRSPEAGELRNKLFESFTFDEITNLSIVRDGLFSEVFGSSAVLVFRRATPAPAHAFLYLCPKPLHDPQSLHRIVIDPHDVHTITHAEAARLPHVWSVLLLGGRRDLALVSRLSRLPTLGKLEERGELKTREGVITGNRKRVLDGQPEIQKSGREVVLPDLRKAHYLEAKRFPPGVFLHLDQDEVPLWGDPRTADSDSTDLVRFAPHSS